MLPLKKILTWFLIGLLLFQEIFYIPLSLPQAAALEVSTHEDVVAIVVEQDLHAAMRDDIEKYALRVQSLLPQTRTVVLSFPRDTHPFVISSALERLYFSGIPNHGKKTQKLTGAILIGHLPLPVVHRDGNQFLSMFPYTDFDEPHFFWNWETEEYDYVADNKTDPTPDIWHSVIDPNSGTLDTDVAQIRSFFARVYEYDKKEGRYADVGRDPQVLYMDSVNESKSSSQGLLASYEQLFGPYQEDFIYHRYTREFAQYLYENFLTLVRSEGVTKISTFAQWQKTADGSSSFLDKASDITTRVFSQELIAPFVKVINEKYLGDVARWVHNTGRYYNGYSEVRLDSIPEMISKKDALATQILKQTNDTFEKIIDGYVDTSMSLDIPLLVSRPFQKTIQESAGRRIETHTYNFLYENHFAGTLASEITDARDCSLLRGSSFGGRNARAELNHAYDVSGPSEDMKLIEMDTKIQIQCNPLTQSYWGGNSPMNTKYLSGVATIGAHRTDDFPVSILDNAGGKRVDGDNSPLDCLRTDLILKPYKHTGIEGRIYPWPAETGGERYSCITNFLTPTPSPFGIDPTPESQENILTSLQSCDGKGNVVLLGRDGSTQSTCSAGPLAGTYKRISSLVKHADPTREIYGDQVKAMASPNLPIDGDRYLLYLDRSAHEARIDYPNAFDIAIVPTDTDDAILQKIIALLAPYNDTLTPGRDLTNSVWSQLASTSVARPDLAGIILGNPDLKAGLVDALRWKSLDIEMKYAHALDLSLSKIPTLSDLLIPEKKDIYEISYLGGRGDAQNFVFGFSPDDNKDLPEWFRNIQNIQNDYQSQYASEDDNGDGFALSQRDVAQLMGNSPNQTKTDDKCGDPAGVVIWEWPEAIQCWLSDLLNTKWFTPDFDQIAFPALPSIGLRIGGNLIWSTKKIKKVQQTDVNNNSTIDYVENNIKSLSLHNTFSDTIVDPQSSFRIDTALEDASSLIDDDLSQVRVEITRIDDLEDKKIYTPDDANWENIRDAYVSISGSGILRDGHAVWSLQSLNGRRARVHIETQLYSSDATLLRSEKTIVLIGKPDVPLTIVGSSGIQGFQAISAGDPAGLRILLGGSEPLTASADLQVNDYVTGEERARYAQVPIIDRQIKVGSPAVDQLIRSAGKYRVKVSIGDIVGETTMTIVPAVADHIVISAPSVFLLDEPQSIQADIVDTWGNIIPPEGWNLSIATSSNVTFSENVGPVKLFSGTFKKAPIVLTPRVGGNLDATFTLISGGVTKSAQISRQVISNIRLVADVAGSSVHEVGKDLPVNFSLQREDGSIIESWNDPLQVRAVGGNARLSESTLNFVGGKAQGKLFTGTRPASVDFSLSDAGLGKIIGKGIEVISGPPERLIITNQATLRAKPGAKDVLRFSLYDSFGNLTDIRNYSLHIEVDAPQLIQPLLTPKLIARGIYETDIVSLGHTGRMLIRAWLQAGAIKSTIKTLENVSLSTFLPVIDSADAKTNTWQTVTQVLLGGPFGQSPTGDYLAGSLLFAPDTKTLSISTLVDTLDASVATVSPSGGIALGSIEYGTGLRVRIDAFKENILKLLITDNRLGNIAQITYPALSSDTLFAPCLLSDEKCDRDTMTFVPTGRNISYKDGKVTRNGIEFFSLKDVFTLPNLTFDFVDTSTDILQFSVREKNTELGVIQMRWKKRIPSASQDSQDTYQIQSLRPELAFRTAWTGSSSYQMPSVVLYDPDAATEPVSGSHQQGWSQYPDMLGLGWTDKNRSLLQFASGQEWSAAQRDHADYLTINIGDPLISLPDYNVHPVTGLDHTLGVPVYQSDSRIADMTFTDINNDARDDLVVYHDDGTVGTRLTRDNGDPLDIGDLFAVQDAADGMIRSGDFLGDGYSDIVYVDLNGTLRFVSYDADGPTEISFKFLPDITLGQIMQIEVFDMDHDGLDDIVIMDHLGTLAIFYGNKSGTFVTQVVDHAYDFVFSKDFQSTYFVGGVRYSGPGFRDLDTLKKPTNIESLTKQERINQTIFMQAQIPKPEGYVAPPRPSLGTVSYESLNNDVNGFMRGYDGDATALGERLKSGYDALEKQAGDRVDVTEGIADRFDVINLLKAPFVDQRNLLIAKKYASLEESGKIVTGSPIEVTMTIKNTSSEVISDLMVLERFPEYLDITDLSYTGGVDGAKTKKSFMLDATNADTGIIDLRSLKLSPGQTYTLTYQGTMRSFTFGRFDVGYLEDSLDPNTGLTIDKEDIRTIQSEALKRGSIPEREFYNHDNYGDIRFNPNETCGGPILLWRSHNTYERTYHKTIIVREVEDPEKNAVEATKDPTSLLASDSLVSDLTDPAALATRVREAQDDLKKTQADSDGDRIPDVSDDDHGDFFELKQNGNSMSLVIGANIDGMIDQISGYVQDILKGLSCGFGSAGCISMPINWAPNAPGNTIAFMGYALPGANTPPVACHNSVLCGTPTFAYPTDCCSGSSLSDQYECKAGGGDNVNICTWPTAPEGAGGLLDYMYMKNRSSNSSSSSSDNGLNDVTSSSGKSTGKTAPKYEKGLGISQFRTWTTPTLTGAIAQIACFGPNDSDSMNLPGFFPVRFDGNCIFAAAPLMQCKDDGSGDTPLSLEMDINYMISEDNNRFANADECHFYAPLDVYPSDVSASVADYLTKSDNTSIDDLQALLDEHGELAQDITHDNSLQFATVAPDDSFSRLNGKQGASYIGNGTGNGLIQISLDPSNLKFKKFGKVIDIEMKSIRAFPNFIMDWAHRQLDEIMSSIGNMPDVKIVLPEITGITDNGWMSSFGQGLGNQFKNIASSPFSQTQSKNTAQQKTAVAQPAQSTTSSSPSASSSSASQISSSNSQNAASTTNASNTNLLTKAGNTIAQGYDTVVGGYKTVIDNTVGRGLDYTSVAADKLGSVDALRDAAVGAIRQKTTGIENAFEYLGTLPIIDVHPETISFNLPWIGKQEAQAWLARNEAILAAWKNLPQDAVGSVNLSPMIGSIEQNIATVKSYLELPEKLQNLFYLKEKLLYGILQNVQAVQELMGGWLYENGIRFRAWVETFILVTKLWDLWQVIIDVFNDYEAQCGVCINERWNLKQWLWIIISLIIPPIPVIAMPKWPDIELDFSDLDLSLDIAYPVFDLSFYPVYLPDAALPTVSGFPVNGMPLLPPLPDLNIDFEVPALQLPDLPDLPPPPKIPELSQAIQVVLKIFKLIVLIECLYKQIPLSPEWFVGTKVAHKTERQGYLPFDFLDVRYPTVTGEWIDNIRVASHVALRYNVTFVTDMLRSALKPLSNFPIDLNQIQTPSAVKFDLDPSKGLNIETAFSEQLPDLLGQLFAATEEPTLVDSTQAQSALANVFLGADIPTAQRARFQDIITKETIIAPDTSITQKKMNERFALLSDALHTDIGNNSTMIADLGAWSRGEKNPEEIAFLAEHIPGTTHLAASNTINDSRFLSLDREVFVPLGSPIAQVLPTATPITNPVIAPLPPVPVPSTQSSFTDQIDTTSLRRTRGLYVINGSTTQRLIDYTEDLDSETKIHAYDDDRDGDQDVYYTLGNTIYRKENHQKESKKYFITDVPEVYNIKNLYFDFFGITDAALSDLHGDGQINIFRTHSKERINFKYFARSASDHVRLDLYGSPLKESPSDALYRFDMIPQFQDDVLDYTGVISRPYIGDVDGEVIIQHKKLYRTLLPGQKYLDENGATQALSADFVIRENQSGYAREKTTVDVIYRGVRSRFALKPGDRILFETDSQVDVIKGSLLLFANTSESRLLTQRDIGLPLLDADRLITSAGGSADVSFVDNTKTRITSSQEWVLSEYDPERGIKTAGVDVKPDWYYGVMVDAHTLQERRFDRSTLFNASTDFDTSDPVAQIPREISLLFDKPTTVDIQQFFPIDIVQKVEVYQLASSEWRRDAESPTRLIFLTQKEKKKILLRVTVNGKVRDYVTSLVTNTPKMAIDSVDASGGLVGTLSMDTDLPLGIQTYVGKNIWSLASGISFKDQQFSASLKDPLYTIKNGTAEMASINRSTGELKLSSATKVEPRITLGKPLSLALLDQGKTTQLTYQKNVFTYSQVTSLADIGNTSGLYLIGNGLHLEPATIADSTLKNGVYITDTQLRPILVLDAQGYVRYMDTNIVWTALIEGDKTIFIMSRDRAELGRLVIKGDMTTYWSGK